MLVLKVINSKNPTLSNCPEKEQYTFRDLYMPNALPWKRNGEGTIKRVHQMTTPSQTPRQPISSLPLLRLRIKKFEESKHVFKLLVMKSSMLL